MSKITRRDVGGNYFHLKQEDKIITSVVFRDCKGTNVNCDYEMIDHSSGVLNVGPLSGETWMTDDLFNRWVEEGHTVKTEEEFGDRFNTPSNDDDEEE